MKSLIFSLVFIFPGALVNAQMIYDYCFDQNGNCSGYMMNDPEPTLLVDDITYPNNVWQIAAPQKTVFNAAHSVPNAIITDSVNSYPINDTSTFLIEAESPYPSTSVHWSYFHFSFSYFVNSDSLTDHGLLEFSPDNGLTWIDLINDPTYVSFLQWSGGKPVLTGNSGGWQNAHVEMFLLGQLLNIQPGTQFYWKFTFISDGNQTNKDGLMIDNIGITITPPVVIEELIPTDIKLIKITDLMGRKVNYESNRLLIFHYSDGSIQKKFVVKN